MTRLRLRICALFFLFGCDQTDPDLLTPDAGRPGACGEGGEADAGGGGGEEDPVASYYPLVDGAEWTYRHGGDVPWDEAVTMREGSFREAPAFLLDDSAGPGGARTESVIERDGSRIWRVHKEEVAGGALLLSVDYEPGFLRFDRCWPAREIGFAETLGYRRREYDSGGRPTSDAAREHTFTIVSSTASVQVPAGEFDGCLQIDRRRTRMPGEAFSPGDDGTFWFCPGVGKVKEVDPSSGRTEELVACNVPGGRCP